FLAVADRDVGDDRVDEVGRTAVAAIVEDAGSHVERLGRDPQAARDPLEDVGRRLAQPAFDLAEVRVRDAGELAQLAEREASVPALIANELAEIVQARL